MKTTVKLYTLNYSEFRTYLIATLFIIGNILLPQLCHLIPKGGAIFLPIYFFTLVAAYKYGWKIGLLTALLSPLINYALFGMPTLPLLPIILIKSVLLAITAGVAAHHFKRLSIPILLLVIISYQLIGTSIESFFLASGYEAVQHFKIGVPGLFIQLFGGFYFINLIRN